MYQGNVLDSYLQASTILYILIAMPLILTITVFFIINIMVFYHLTAHKCQVSSTHKCQEVECKFVVSQQTKSTLCLKKFGARTLCLIALTKIEHYE